MCSWPDAKWWNTEQILVFTYLGYALYLIKTLLEKILQDEHLR